MKGLVYKGDIVDLLYETAETATPDDENLLANLETKVNELDDVDASENKTAHWIKGRTTMECSRCGNDIEIKDRDYCNLTKYDFCPCCGSWMHEDAAR